MNLKKTEVHRKKILAKSKMQALKGAKVSLEMVLQAPAMDGRGPTLFFRQWSLNNPKSSSLECTQNKN